MTLRAMRSGCQRPAPAADRKRREAHGFDLVLERLSLTEGTRLIRQGEPPDDVYVLESGRLRVELVTPEGTQMRLSTVLPGVMVGEIGLYTRVSRTADVVAETPSVVLRLNQRQRAALLLVDLLGYSSEQAGRILSVRPSTVRALATQGRRALRAKEGWRDA